MKNFLRQWGAVAGLLIIFLLSWLGQGVSQYYEIKSENETHGIEFQWDDYWSRFGSATLENWQSEFLQLSAQCIFIASYMQSRWFRADFNADKEDVERLETKIDKILEGNNEH